MINYPNSLDTEENLYESHDGLRLQLKEDYSPGDTSIQVFGNDEIIRRFPDTGILTLTEQCSDDYQKAISFYYTSKTSSSFEGLELIDGFVDTAKPKVITNVIQNVMAQHHNIIKDAIIALEQFLGKKGEISNKPLQGKLEARANYIRKFALSPKAWFSCNKTVGLVPLTVEFQDLSSRVGTDGVQFIWDFGDNTSPSIIEIEENDLVTANNVIVNDLDGKTISKVYTMPGEYDVKLTVKNVFGEDTVILPKIVNARVQAPDEAVIVFDEKIGQIYTPGSPVDGPYTTLPKLRTPINTIVELSIPSGRNPNTNKSYSGEELNTYSQPIDAVTNYTWSLADDLTHNNSTLARASYSIGGINDIVLRVDTKFGGYRITTYEDVIDVVEKDNLWLWTIDSGSANSYEFGLLSETFKVKSNSSLTVNYDDSFLDGEPNEEQQKREFARNNGFTPRGITKSGLGGTGLLYWASGRSSAQSASDEEVLFAEFNGFNDTYVTQDSISRPWNWVSFASTDSLYFILGGITSAYSANDSPTNQTKHTMDLNDLSVTSSTLTTSNYKNGADELMQNEVNFDDDGVSEQGNMSVYRSCWSEDTGYFLRNEGVGDFFRIKSFYKTSGTSVDSFVNIRKVNDMTGSIKTEGQLVPMQTGLFFFNNSGSIAVYNPTTDVWVPGGPGVNSSSFRLLQDSEVSGFDDSGNTLLAASDNDQIAYLSYDYSENAFFKFNSTDLTFTKVGARPVGEQWQMAIW